jgi:hypothetical protein
VRREQVFVIDVEPGHPTPLLRPRQLGLRRLGERQVEREVPIADRHRFAGLLQALLRVLAHRFQQPVTLAFASSPPATFPPAH